MMIIDGVKIYIEVMMKEVGVYMFWFVMVGGGCCGFSF